MYRLAVANRPVSPSVTAVEKSVRVWLRGGARNKNIEALAAGEPGITYTLGRALFGVWKGSRSRPSIVYFQLVLD